MNKQQLKFGQKTDKYPHGYGYCQCGCGSKTYEFLPNIYRKFKSLHRQSKLNKWLPDIPLIKSKAEIRRTEKERAKKILKKKLENIPTHEPPDKLKRIFEHYGIEPRDIPKASQALNDGDSFIYLIRCASFVKIGIAENVEQRIRGLQTGNPFDLFLLKKFPSKEPKNDERALHSMLVQYHKRGEWFHLPPTILARLLNMKDLDEIYDLELSIEDKEMIYTDLHENKISIEDMKLIETEFDESGILRDYKEMLDTKFTESKEYRISIKDKEMINTEFYENEMSINDIEDKSGLSKNKIIWNLGKFKN